MLSLTEKNQLMSFFKLVQQHLKASVDQDNGNEDCQDLKIFEEDLKMSDFQYTFKCFQISLFDLCTY